MKRLSFAEFAILVAIAVAFDATVSHGLKQYASAQTARMKSDPVRHHELDYLDRLIARTDGRLRHGLSDAVAANVALSRYPLTKWEKENAVDPFAPISPPIGTPQQPPLATWDVLFTTINAQVRHERAAQVDLDART